ncbi:MAG: NAD-dependent epimerase/dehydratase family protein [Planctomycetota bacterium]
MFELLSDGSQFSERESKFLGKKIALTGASGFIGHRLAQALAKIEGSQIRALVRPGSVTKLKELASRLDVIEGGLEDADALARLVEGAEFVFHLAGATRARNRAEFQSLNADGTGAVAKAVAAASAKTCRLVYVSSLAAAGPTAEGAEPRDEDCEPAPVSHYGRSKLEGEEQLKSAMGAHSWSIARPPAVYGPGERDFFEMFRMVRRRFAPRLGFQSKELSMVYADDLVQALLVLASSKKAAGRTYFVAHPEQKSDLELMEYMEDAMGRWAWKPRIPFFAARIPAAFSALGQAIGKRPALLNPDRLRELAPTRWVCNSDRLDRELGFRCTTPLEIGIPLTAAWYSKSGWWK